MENLDDIYCSAQQANAILNLMLEKVEDIQNENVRHALFAVQQKIQEIKLGLESKLWPET